MGIFDRFISDISGRDYNVNDKLALVYGPKQVSKSFVEVERSLRPKIRETENINDLILAKYNKTTKDDIQNELMKKYLKISRDDLNQQEIARKELEQREIDKEVDESLEGVDKNTKDQIKKDLKEEKTEKKDESIKDKKKELQARIYKATYNRMYKDYTNNVLRVKDAQFAAMGIALTSKEAIEMIAYEKNLEKIELMYHKATGKEFSQDKDIRQKREEFKHKFEYDQKGINANTNERSIKINRLYAIREEKHRKYLDALMDKSKTPQEIALYKRDYQEANLDLIQNVPSLQEYTKDLETQAKNEKIAKEAGLENKSAVNNRIDNRNLDDSKNRSEKVTDSKMADLVEDVQKTENRRDEMNFEYSKNVQKEQLEKGNYGVAKEIGDTQTSRRIYDENIEKTPNQSTIAETKKDVEKQQERNDDMFLSSLRAGVNDMDNIQQDDIDRVEKIAKEEIMKKAYEEQQKQLNDEQYQRERRKKTSNNNKN